MNILKSRFIAMMLVALNGLLGSDAATAVEVQVSIRHLGAEGGVALSPFTWAAHDGTFSSFSPNSPASSGIEAIAELGDGSAWTASVLGTQPTAKTGTLVANQGGFGPGIFVPGSSGSAIVTLDPALNRYFSFGSMVVPSNDAFVGNSNAMSLPLFDNNGQFIATTLTLTGADIWDAGTEVNQLLGAAYLVNQTATDGTAENGMIHRPNLATDFNHYLNGSTPSGGVFSMPPTATGPIAEISFSIVPEPSSLGLLAVAAVSFLRRTRQRVTLA